MNARIFPIPGVIAGLYLACAGLLCSAPARYYVRAGGTGDGTSWADASGDLQRTINSAAIDGIPEVWVAEGTYLPEQWPNGGSAPREVHFSLRNKVAVLGGFPATGDPGMADRDPALHPVILSGDIGTRGVATDNAYHVLYHTGTAAIDDTARLDGVTITAGNANGGGIHNYGGGICQQSANPVLLRCVFQENSSLWDGGGVYNSQSKPYFGHCVFERNSGRYGGGMFNYQSSMSVVNCVFNGNGGSNGGAMHNYDASSPEVLACTFFADDASGSGEVMYNNLNCTPILSNTIVWGEAGTQIVDAAGTGCVTTLNSCVIRDGWSGAGAKNIADDPLFADADSPKGKDGIWATNDDGLKLTAPSPALDNGHNAFLPTDNMDIDDDSDLLEALPWDLRSLSRIVNGTLDRGAYEFQRPIVTFVPGSHGTRVGGGALVQTLDEGADAVVPILALELGWSFVGWDQDFTNVYVDLTVNAQYAPFFAPGATCHVRVGGTGNGGSWATAAGDLQKAIDVMAMAGGQVWVGAGTYMPATWPNGGTLAREKHFSLRNNVTVVGSFPATGNPGLSERGPSTPTVCSGDIGAPGATDNTYHVFYHPASAALNPTARLDGVVITAGNADVSPNDYGGGMFISVSGPTLMRCQFEGNQAAFQGGGLYVGTAEPVLLNCVFTNNSAPQGGAVFTYQAMAQFRNCVFTGNSSGVGILHAFGGNAPILVNCTMGGNAGTGIYTNGLSSPVQVQK